jgi:DnaD/phage-associated family protein
MLRFTGEKYLAVPALLIEKYQPVVGPLATIIWIDLYLLAKENVEDWKEPLKALTGFNEEDLQDQLELLKKANLIDEEGDSLLINEPMPFEVPIEEVAATDNNQSLDEKEKKMEAVYDYYHERIGMMGAKEFMLLNEWVEVRGMSPELVAKAIDITAENAQFPSMKYLDGVLKNWHNANIKRLQDLEQPRPRPTSTFKSEGGIKSTTSDSVAPNPNYKAVDPERIRRWKEMFKDEYKD